MSATTREQLACDIRKTFESLPYPGDTNLFEGMESINYLGLDGQPEEFFGKHWDMLTSPFLERMGSCIHLFSPSAFRFYLPSFMLACINTPNELEFILDETVAVLTGPLDIEGETKDCFMARVQSLSEAQHRTVVAFLQYVEHHLAENFVFDEPRRALDSYWLFRKLNPPRR